MQFLIKRYKRGVLIFFGGTVYCLMEVAFRGFTHISMFFTGGTCFFIISAVNARLKKSVAIWKRLIMGSCVITGMEFIAGCIVNLWLKLDVWDYSKLPMNVRGQICLPFSAAWCAISVPILIIGNYIDKHVFSLKEV